MSKSVLFPAVLSNGSALVSFFATTLPVLQWCAAFVAIISGTIGTGWVIIQYLRRNRVK